MTILKWNLHKSWSAEGATWAYNDQCSCTGSESAYVGGVELAITADNKVSVPDAGNDGKVPGAVDEFPAFSKFDGTTETIMESIVFTLTGCEETIVFCAQLFPSTTNDNGESPSSDDL